MASLSSAQLSAASEFGTEVMQAFDEAGAFPAETVIAAVARMAGSFLLRSLGLSLTGVKPGTVVLSEQANVEGPRLIQILSGVLDHVGVKLDQAKIGDTRDAPYRPQGSFLETQKLLEPQFAAIRDKYKLTDGEAADAAAAATAVLIKNCSGRLDPHVGFGLAIYGFIEGSKTAPAVAPGESP